MATQTQKNDGYKITELPKELMQIPRELAGRGRDVYLAGLGAVASVEEEGTTLFSTLVERGKKMEQRGRKQVDEMRETVNTRQRQAVDTVEDTVYEPMLGAMKRFGVPTRAEVRDLSANVDALSNKVDALIRKLDRQTRAAAAETSAEYTAYSVVPHEEGWSVEKEGLQRAVSVHPTKEEALERGRTLANDNAPSQLVVCKRDGTVQDTLTYEA